MVGMVGFIEFGCRRKRGYQMNTWMQIILTSITSILASSGLWAYMMKRMDMRDVQDEMLIGLAHDRILYLGMSYIERGYITRDEYENLHDYLYAPYMKLGGNGSAKRIMQEVDKLPIKNHNVEVKNSE